MMNKPTEPKKKATWSIFTCKVCKDQQEFYTADKPYTDVERIYPNTKEFDNGFEYAHCRNCGVMIQIDELGKWITPKTEEFPLLMRERG